MIDRLHIILRRLVKLARGLPPDKIDLLFLLQGLDRPRVRGKKNNHCTRTGSTKAVSVEQLAGQLEKHFANKDEEKFSAVAGIELFLAHLLFVSVYLTLHLGPTKLSEKIDGLPCVFSLAKLAAEIGGAMQWFRDLFRVEKWRADLPGSFRYLFDRADQVLYRMWDFKRTDRRFAKLVPRALRRPAATATLYSTRWIQLCQDIAHLVPDLTTLKGDCEMISTFLSGAPVPTLNPESARSHAIGDALHTFIMRYPADEAMTNGFKGRRHDDLLDLLRKKAIQRFNHGVTIEILQSLQDAGCDLLFRWDAGPKYGVQLKSHGDIAQENFAGTTMTQIQDSKQHGLNQLYVLLAGNLTDNSQREKMRSFQARISKQKDSYVIVVPADRVWTLLFQTSFFGF